MKRTRLLAVLAIAMVAGLLVTGCKSPMGLTQDTRVPAHVVNAPPEIYTIWAGQNQNAGNVTVWFDKTNLYIKYQMTGNWWLEETHAHVALTLNGIPQKNGNPIPGKFEFKNSFSPRVQTWTYTIPKRDGWECDVELYIATHCVVRQLVGGKYVNEQTGWAGPHKFPGKNWALYIKYQIKCPYKDVTLPTDPVKMAVFDDKIKSEFDVLLDDVPSGYDVWDGHWLGWCAEYNVGIGVSGLIDPSTLWYDVRLWSSQDPLLPDRPTVDGDAWDNVNYLLNHKLLGATAYEIQVALWWLLNPSITNLPPLTVNAKLMYDEAVANGDGWRPGTGQWLAVICDAPPLQIPNGPLIPVQRVFIEVDP